MRYFIQRLLQFVIVFFLVTFGVMVFMRIGMNKPGDPALKQRLAVATILSAANTCE